MVAKIASRPFPFEIRSGQLRSLTTFSVGRALLASRPDAEISSWVKSCNLEVLTPETRLTELNNDFCDTGVKFTRTPVKLSEFMRIMARAQGYAVAAGDEVP